MPVITFEDTALIAALTVLTVPVLLAVWAITRTSRNAVKKHNKRAQLYKVYARRMEY